MCVCVFLCEGEVCVHANRLEGGVAMGVACCKKVQNIQMIHRQDLVKRLLMSQRTADQLFRTAGKKGAWQWEWPETKKVHSFQMDSCNMAKLCRNTHSHTLSLVMAYPAPS